MEKFLIWNFWREFEGDDLNGGSWHWIVYAARLEMWLMRSICYDSLRHFCSSLLKKSFPRKDPLLTEKLEADSKWKKVQGLDSILYFI